MGNRVGPHTTAPVVGITLGALFSYLLGGVIGRFIDKGMRGAVGELRAMPASEVFAGSVVGTTGLLLGLVAGLPVIALVHSSIDYPLVSAFAWVLCVSGVRIGVTKGKEIVRAAGMSHLLDRPAHPPPPTALLLDSSAVMDRYLMVLGRAGLLGGGVVLPRFVADEVRAMSEGPDPVASRRARRGLEAVEALRAMGVDVLITEDEVPQFDDTVDRVIAVAHRLHVRLATCSVDAAERAVAEDLEVVDFRRLAVELTPDHPPGEHLVIDLVKEGRQARQAVGYLPEGDMVVVNDAAHLVGQGEIEVVVSAARQTSQGLLFFARLFEGGPTLAQRTRTG
ncbi:MAG: hypothetical protein ABSG81_11825 [Acidimicrobiales bacterium]